MRIILIMAGLALVLIWLASQRAGRGVSPWSLAWEDESWAGYIPGSTMIVARAPLAFAITSPLRLFK